MPDGAFLQSDKHNVYFGSVINLFILNGDFGSTFDD